MRSILPIIPITFALFSSALGQDDSDEGLAETAEAMAEGATLFPIPDYTSDLLTREALTGDWGGRRTALEERGLRAATMSAVVAAAERSKELGG